MIHIVLELGPAGKSLFGDESTERLHEMNQWLDDNNIICEQPFITYSVVGTPRNRRWVYLAEYDFYPRNARDEQIIAMFKLKFG